MATSTRRAKHKDPAGQQERRKAIQKATTGFVGLDEVLRGGLPAGRMTLFSGGPGSGKSLMGLQSLMHSAGAGEPGIVVLFEERAAAVRQNARSLGWDLATLERKNLLFLMDARVNPELVISGDFSVKGLLAILDHQTKTMGARRIVFDAVDTLLHLYDSPSRERHELYAIHEWLLNRGLTAIMTVKTVQKEESPPPVRVFGLHGGLCHSRRPARHGSDHHAPIESGQISWFGIWPQ